MEGNREEGLKRQLCFCWMTEELTTALEQEIINGPIGAAVLRSGCALGYLLAADGEPDFAAGAYKNLKLLEACTHDGCLYGGLYTHEMGNMPASTTTFSHAKVLAGILDRGLEELLEKQEQLNKEGAKAGPPAPDAA